MADLTLLGSASFSASSNAAFNQELSGGASNSALTFHGRSAFTVEFRLTATESQSGLRVFVGKEKSFWIGKHAESGAEGITCRYGSSPNEEKINASIVPVVGQTYHIALVLGPLGGKLFVDGVLTGSNSTPYSSSTPASSAFPFVINEGFNSNSPAIDSTAKIDEVAVFDYEKYDASFTPPTAPYVGDESGLVSLYHLDGDGVDSKGAAPSVSIYPDNTAIVYSPYNWLVNSTSAKTVNPGAYFKTILNGASATLVFDTSLVSATRIPNIRVYMNGDLVVDQKLAETVTVNKPSDSSANSHLIEFYLDAAPHTTDRWAGDEGGVIFKGLAASSISTPVKRPYKTLIFGDSITEGFKTLSGSNSGDNEVDNNSATRSWAKRLGELLNSEVGVIAWAGQGIQKGGSGNIPQLSDAWDFLWSGQPNDFSDSPNLCIWLHGQNDGTASTVTQGLLALNAQLAAMKGTKFVLLRPLKSNDQAANLQTIVGTCDEPKRVRYQDTAGIHNENDGPDTTHPYAFSCMAKIAPSFGNLLKDDIGEIFTGTPSSLTLTIDAPNGDHKTVLLDENENVVYSGEVSYSNGSATLSGLEVASSSLLRGYVDSGSTVSSEGCGVKGESI